MADVKRAFRDVRLTGHVDAIVRDLKDFDRRVQNFNLFLEKLGPRTQGSSTEQAEEEGESKNLASKDAIIRRSKTLWDCEEPIQQLAKVIGKLRETLPSDGRTLNTLLEGHAALEKLTTLLTGHKHLLDEADDQMVTSARGWLNSIVGAKEFYTEYFHRQRPGNEVPAKPNTQVLVQAFKTWSIQRGLCDFDTAFATCEDLRGTAFRLLGNPNPKKGKRRPAVQAAHGIQAAQQLLKMSPAEHHEMLRKMNPRLELRGDVAKYLDSMMAAVYETYARDITEAVNRGILANEDLDEMGEAKHSFGKPALVICSGFTGAANGNFNDLKSALDAYDYESLVHDLGQEHPQAPRALIKLMSIAASMQKQIAANALHPDRPGYPTHWVFACSALELKVPALRGKEGVWAMSMLGGKSHQITEPQGRTDSTEEKGPLRIPRFELWLDGPN